MAGSLRSPSSSLEMIQWLDTDLSRVIVLAGLVMAMLIVAHIDVARPCSAVISVPVSSEHGHEHWIGPCPDHEIARATCGSAPNRS